MPRNSAGTYTLPAGNPVVAGTTIDASWANDTMSDMANEITNSLSRTGAGGMLAPFRVADGTVSAPGLGFTNETNSGLYRAGTGELWFTIGGVAVAQITGSGLLIPSGKRISLPAPVNDADAANKEYVDDLVNPVIQYANYYLGPKSSDPSVNNSGGPLTEGTTYWSTTLDQMRVYNGTNWVPMPTISSLVGQTFNGTGAQTAFTLANPTGDAINLEVFISGVRQVPTTDYSVSGTTLTFVAAPPSGTDNIFVRYAQLAAITDGAAAITYTPAGTGAVPTTVQTKLRGLPAASDYSSLANALAANAGPVFISSNRLGGVQYATDRRDKKYRFLAGVIRQDTPGSGWYFLTTGAHGFAGFSGTLSISGSDLVINYGFTASNVVSLIAVPDETFAAGGLVVGASVGTSSAILSLYTPFDMRTSGTAIAVGNYLESGVDVTATFDIANGTCAVTHPSISHVDSQGGFVSVQPLGLPDGNQYTGVANSVTKTGFTINYRHAIYGRVNGAAITTLNTGSSASWNGTDTLTITHPASGAALGDVSLSPGDGTYIPICTASTATTITVQFRDYAGTLYTGASSPAIFYYLRGGMATSTISGAAKLHARRGLVQARASYVASTAGNIWLYGVMEEA